MRRYFLKMSFLCCAIAMAGCSPRSQNGGASESDALKPASAHVEGGPATASDAGLVFAAPPAGWIAETPSSSSRQAQYRLPRAGGDPEDAELVIYYFHGGGGTPQANVDRWIGQFTGPDGKPVSNTAKIIHKTVGGIRLTLVDVSGTYSSSMGPIQPGGRPKGDFRMLGAIAEAGNGPWFIKLTGPERTVAKWETSFGAFLDSIRQDK